MRGRGKDKRKRAAKFDGADFFVVKVLGLDVRGCGRPQRDADDAEVVRDPSTCDIHSLVRLAATVAVETQCRVFKDDAILAGVISRELGWHVASVPPAPSSSLSCFFPLETTLEPRA